MRRWDWGRSERQQVAGAIQRLLHTRTVRPDEAAKPRAPAQREPQAAIQGIGDLLSTYARCCKPVPPEPIAGYITVGRGVRHRQPELRDSRGSPWSGGRAFAGRLGREGSARPA